MIVVTRKQDESVMVGDDIEVTVNSVIKDKVKLTVCEEGGSFTVTLGRDEIQYVGKGVTVSVVDIRGDQVSLSSVRRKARLCLDGPRNVSLHRKEVWDAIKQEADQLVMGQQISRTSGLAAIGYDRETEKNA